MAAYNSNALQIEQNLAVMDICTAQTEDYVQKFAISCGFNLLLMILV